MILLQQQYDQLLKLHYDDLTTLLKEIELGMGESGLLN